MKTLTFSTPVLHRPLPPESLHADDQIVFQHDIYLCGQRCGTRLHWVSRRDCAQVPGVERWLGCDQQQQYFVRSISQPIDHPQHLWLPARPTHLLHMDPRDAHAFAQATALAHWHTSYRFCGYCGHQTQETRQGWARQCTYHDCKREHFPRIDPAVMMLIYDQQGRLLLGRAASWRPGMYSILAGFVEPGETLEHAVEREVYEEVGIEIDSPQYVASQPWPFPRSLMIGFMARARTTVLNIDPVELEHADWFSPETLRADDSLLPRPESLSRTLINHYLENYEREKQPPGK